MASTTLELCTLKAQLLTILAMMPAMEVKNAVQAPPKILKGSLKPNAEAAFPAPSSETDIPPEVKDISCIS